jgi:hypothetical protein
LGEEETAHKRALESLVKRASKPNKKITIASRLPPVHGLLSNVFASNQDWIQSSEMEMRVIPLKTWIGISS